MVSRTTPNEKDYFDSCHYLGSLIPDEHMVSLRIGFPEVKSRKSQNRKQAENLLANISAAYRTGQRWHRVSIRTEGNSAFAKIARDQTCKTNERPFDKSRMIWQKSKQRLRVNARGRSVYMQIQGFKKKFFLFYLFLSRLPPPLASRKELSLESSRFSGPRTR